MLRKLVHITKSDLVKVFSFSALSTTIKMLTAFVSVKVLAVLIGPTGIALLGQLNNFTSIVLIISTAGISNGIIKYTAQYATSPSELQPILSTSFRIIILFSLICSVCLISGGEYFSMLIFHTSEYKSIFVIFGATIILYSLNSFLLSILNGYKEFKKYIVVNIVSSFAGLIVSVALVLFWGTYGALLSIVTYQSAVFFITAFVVFKSHWFKVRALVGRLSSKPIYMLAQYSIMALVGAVSLPTCQLIIRSHISNQISLTEAGLWEGLNRISTMYLTIITTSLSVYYLPRLSELKSEKEIRTEIFRTYKIIIPLVIFAAILIFLFKGVIIHLLFNDSFNGMRGLFSFQLIGDVFKIASWILAYLFIAKANIKGYVAIEILFSTSFVLISLFLINEIGTIGATLAYAFNYFWYFLMMLWIFRKLLFKNKRVDL